MTVVGTGGKVMKRRSFKLVVVVMAYLTGVRQSKQPNNKVKDEVLHLIGLYRLLMIQPRIAIIRVMNSVTSAMVASALNDSPPRTGDDMMREFLSGGLLGLWSYFSECQGAL